MNAPRPSLAKMAKHRPDGFRLKCVAAAVATLFAATSAGIQAAESIGGLSIGFIAATDEPLIDEHDFINPKRSRNAAGSMVELEKLFWLCDYSATNGMLDMHEIEMCSAVTKGMQRAKFNDDFEELLKWWRLNKETEHYALNGAGVVEQCSQANKQ
ncbi:MAG: hypothetical protein ACXW16_00890 [Burkholderiaceae bacterium]